MADLNSITSRALADIAGRAFTETLLMIAERDLPNTLALGSRLLRELNARGLTVVPTYTVRHPVALVPAP